MEEKVKNQLLSLLDKFVAVCDENHLQYYLAGGSVIGAVRHKGLIPWDDDIDVHMPRADYEKLQTLPDEVWGENMRLATWRKTKNYTYDFLKLELTNTTVIERLHPDYIGGIFLDVFPLDFISDNQAEVSLFEDKLRRISKRYIECTIKNDNECKSILELLRLKIKRAFYNHKNQMGKWEQLAMSFDNRDEKIMFAHDYFYYKGGMEEKWFGKGAMLEFEGRKVLVPSDYDAYLRHIFGDYMKLPPVESRKGHAFLYVNYDKRVSREEANMIFAELHNRFAYKFSLRREIKCALRNYCHIKM